MQLDQLQHQISLFSESTPTESTFHPIEERVDDIARQLEELKNSRKPSATRFIMLKQDLGNEVVQYDFATRPLVESIGRLSDWDANWLAEQENWKVWQAQLLKDRDSPQLSAAFARAIKTIETARGTIARELEALMVVQARGGQIRSRILAMDSEMQTIISGKRQSYLLGKSPPIFSRQYFEQFEVEMFKATGDGVRLLAFPNRTFFFQHMVGFFLILLLFLAILAFERKHREQLLESERWGFFPQRPLATALFSCALIFVIYFEFWGSTLTLRIMVIIVGILAFVRLLGVVVSQPWRKKAAYWLLLNYLFSIVMTAIGLPSPLFSLYIFFASVLTIFFFLRWAKECSKNNDPAIFPLVLRLFAGLAAFVILAELWGKDGIASTVFLAALRSLAIILTFMLFIFLIRGGLHWIFFKSPVWEIKQLRNDADDLARKVGYLVEVALTGVVLVPILMTAWGLADTVPQAINSLLGVGVMIHTQWISVGTVFLIWLTIYCSLLISWVLPKLVMDDMFAGGSMERGVKRSTGRLIQYTIVLIGFLVVLNIMGLDFTKLTIVLSAFGVGIGFGLQGIVSNFVSGLIMLFERPLREGDTIEVGGSWAQIKKIGLRSTRVQTFDEADMSIPNSDLINNQVTNWTLGNRQVRVKIPIGVAYGSDLALVQETMLACGKDHETVLKSPEPHVLFLGMGESALNFEMRVWVQDADSRHQVSSDLYLDIDSRFRKAGITIPFPQRDLHIINGDSKKLDEEPGVDEPTQAEPPAEEPAEEEPLPEPEGDPKT